MSATPPTSPEAQPLLSVAEQPRYHDEPVTTSSISDEESTLVADAPKTRSLSTIAFQAAIILFSLIVVGLFIKGFIDADDVESDLSRALKSALGGGLSGAAVMIPQVLTLMPLRTVMNYQCRYGTTTTEVIKMLYADGGWTRYYHGLAAALIQGPVSRFGDTAANAGILALLQSNTFMRKLPMLVQTAFVSVAAAHFRMILTPIDTIKTAMQTEGKSGITLLKARVKKHGISSLWHSVLATAAVALAGHYPWYGTYNYLDANLPLPTTVLEKLLRSTVIGFAASVVSDPVSNSLRVIKTYHQVHATHIGHTDVARAVIAADGVSGLFGRGLKTRILANSLQSIMFSILWKLFLDLWNEKTSRT